MPSEGMSSSPTQRMFGRRTRTLLPTTSNLLKPKVQEDVKEKFLKEKAKQTKYCNQNTKELKPLQTGEVVHTFVLHQDWDYCNVLFYGLLIISKTITDCNVSKIQQTRVVCQVSKFKHKINFHTSVTRTTYCTLAADSLSDNFQDIASRPAQ